MDIKITIREIEKSEIKLLDHFLYDAIFIPEGQEKPGKEIIKRPELSKYNKDFGRANDVCLVAAIHGDVIGAIWTRIFPEHEKGYGYVDSKTPELTMSVNKNYQKQGIGTKLLERMIDKLIQLKYKQVSLSVTKVNYAQKLYEKFGFITIESDHESATMIKKLLP